MNGPLWFNGRVVDARRALVPILDRAAQHGLGLFEVTRGYSGVPFRLDRHLDRMRASAKRFGLPVPFRDAETDRAVRSLLRRCRIDDASVRLVVTGGAPGVRPSAMIQVSPRPRLPAAWYRRGAALRWAEWIRDPRGPLHGHKTLNYLENLLARETARVAGCADSLFLDPAGRVLEGTRSNVFAVRRGVLLTPALGPILPGVTRQVVLEVARELRIPVRERAISRRQLEGADEVFITSSLAEVVPVGRVGKRRIGRGGAGDLTRALADGFRRVVERETR